MQKLFHRAACCIVDKNTFVAFHHCDDCVKVPVDNSLLRIDNVKLVTVIIIFITAHKIVIFLRNLIFLFFSTPVPRFGTDVL